MSRADEIRARAEVEASVADLEEQLREAKEAGEVSIDLKLELRDARRAYREQRDQEV